MTLGFLPPARTAAERMAARSTRSGTPVKSCKRTRATTNGTSSVRASRGPHDASARTSASRTRLPSQLRSKDSRTTRKLTGRRDTRPTPARSSAGSEQNLTLRPGAISNESMTSNSDFIAASI